MGFDILYRIIANFLVILAAVDYVQAYFWLAQGDYRLSLLTGVVSFITILFASHVYEWAKESENDFSY